MDTRTSCVPVNMPIGMEVLQALEDFPEHRCDGKLIQDTMLDVHRLHSELENVEQTSAIEQSKHQPQLVIDYKRGVIVHDILVIALAHHLDLFLNIIQFPMSIPKSKHLQGHFDFVSTFFVHKI